MTDRLRRGLFPSRGLRAVLVRIGDTARMARMLHGLAPTASWLFAEALAGAAIAGALQKDLGRVNLQVACDGPLRGLFVDADPEGNVRGYVRAPGVHFPGDPARGALAALGGAGYLSMLRSLADGQIYRSAVDLGADGLAGALRRWFAASEQVETALDVAVVPREGELLGDVVALLVQRLPDGDPGAVAAVRAALAEGALRDGLAAGRPAQELLEALAGEPLDLLADQEVSYRCGCSAARARAAVSVLGADGVAELLRLEGKAEVDCEFCHAHYRLDAAELRELERRLRADGGGGGATG